MLLILGLSGTPKRIPKCYKNSSTPTLNIYERFQYFTKKKEMEEVLHFLENLDKLQTI